MKKALLMSVLSFAVIVPSYAADKPAVPVEPVEAVEVSDKKPVFAKRWGYVGAGAAHRWADLAPEYKTCKEGTEQSPINIAQFKQGDLAPLNPSYTPVPLVVMNTGHSVKVKIESGNSFSIEDKVFNLSHFKFRTPGEHYVDGAPYPMEAQFFHKTQGGEDAVVAVMFKVGAHNPVIEGIWQNVPQAGASKDVAGVDINVGDLMPASKSYYSYKGSLTEPPCSEGVQWYILQEPVELSAEQLTAFQAVFPVNARPIQDLGQRFVVGN